MKKSFKLICSIAAIAVLSACGPKDVQPLQSLSAVQTGEIHVANVDVSLSPEYVARIDEKVAEENENIAAQNKRITDSADQSSRKQKQVKTAADKSIEKSEKKIKAIQTETASIESDVKVGITDMIASKFAGSRAVDVDVTVNSFSTTNGAAVMLIGGSDSMSGLLRIKDSQSSELLGEYHITDLDTNAAGGLLGLMVRGGDPRGDMIKQFSEKVSDVLAGKYSE